ncbi:PAAR domain-containing protein [Afifella sp. YEN Y35]|uniref:PAAR domain-containing protein n=1 Tax=Afifella sp. YEN Y35 TaxID=3388337 RepID=UPI0039DF3D19
MSGIPVILKCRTHVRPAIDPGPKPHVGGPVVSTQQTFVTVGGVPIATIGDKTLCSGVPRTAAITGGSSVATIEGKRVAASAMPASMAAS